MNKVWNKGLSFLFIIHLLITNSSWYLSCLAWAQISHFKSCLVFGLGCKDSKFCLVGEYCQYIKPNVFDEINQYYSTCQSLLLLCLSWEKVEFRTHKSVPYKYNWSSQVNNNNEKRKKIAKKWNFVKIFKGPSWGVG